MGKLTQVIAILFANVAVSFGQQQCACQQIDGCISDQIVANQANVALCRQQCTSELGADANRVIQCYSDKSSVRLQRSQAYTSCLGNQNARRCTGPSSRPLPVGPVPVLPNTQAPFTPPPFQTPFPPNPFGPAIPGQTTLSPLPFPFQPNRNTNRSNNFNRRGKRHAGRRLGIPQLTSFDSCVRTCVRSATTNTFNQNSRFGRRGNGFLHLRVKRGGGRGTRRAERTCASQAGCTLQRPANYRTARDTCRTQLQAQFNRTQLFQDFCSCIAGTTLGQNSGLNCATIANDFGGRRGRGGRGRGRGFFRDAGNDDDDENDDEEELDIED